ncbi:flagellar hook-basal body complex protein [Aquibacillus halophilus]|uniref:Flagellar hook-basal body complex protein n=1 Tax=Aquibacillus halophilus TaxID=930132 RepID=A0A6A8DHH2_9BACI|nr:flagellar hook-basal body protein [Aquibacillus halophilus]MRH43946.1 flagellar hook-basal body complex protein [Aquibacillus halophilus]
MSRMAIQAAVTMGQLQNKMDIIGHNMANVNTNGYKSRQADFSSLLFQQIDNLSNPEVENVRLTPDGIRVGNGAKLGHTNINLSQGTIADTGRSLDVALLADNHLFQVNVTENGITETQFTRSGTFYLNPLDDGTVMLTNKQGHPVVGENGPIIFADDFDSISFSNNGTIQVTRNGNTEVEGQLAIVEAIRPRLLEAAGDNNLRFGNVEGVQFNQGEIIQDVAANQVQLKSQALESSNVDIAKQMTELTLTQRAYQFNARSISMNDQMMGLVNQLR